MRFTFAEHWERDRRNVNNQAVYSDGRRLSRREVYVIVDKIKRSDIWADRDEQRKVANFIEDLKNNVDIEVLKGAHGDKYSRDFGLHLTVVVNSGCNIGNTFHLYGHVMRNGAWEVDFISTYNPKIGYHPKYAVKVHNAVAPSAPIVALHGSLPLTTQERWSDLAVIRERA